VIPLGFARYATRSVPPYYRRYRGLLRELEDLIAKFDKCLASRLHELVLQLVNEPEKKWRIESRVEFCSCLVFVTLPGQVI